MLYKRQLNGHNLWIIIYLKFLAPKSGEKLWRSEGVTWKRGERLFLYFSGADNDV